MFGCHSFIELRNLVGFVMVWVGFCLVYELFFFLVFSYSSSWDPFHELLFILAILYVKPMYNLRLYCLLRI